jgi:hypothetical protein
MEPAELDGTGAMLKKDDSGLLNKSTEANENAERSNNIIAVLPDLGRSILEVANNCTGRSDRS